MVPDKNQKQIESSLQIAAMGTCNIDFLMKVPRFSEADDEVDIEDMKIFLGGSAANFAINISRLGIKAGLIARVGNDEYGKYAINQLKEEGINIEQLKRISHSTGMAFIAVDGHGERSIYTAMGANAHFKLEKSDKEYIKSAPVLHLTGIYWEVAIEASKHAQLLSFNPGNALASYGLERLKKLIKRSHILFLNRKEVLLLTGEEYKKGAQHLVNMGVSQVVVTCGEQGACLYTVDGVFHSPKLTGKAYDTTGAGDAFAAGFIAEFLKSKDPVKCLESGNQSALGCVENWGAVGLNIP